MLSAVALLEARGGRLVLRGQRDLSQFSDDGRVRGRDSREIRAVRTQCLNGLHSSATKEHEMSRGSSRHRVIAYLASESGSWVVGVLERMSGGACADRRRPRLCDDGDTRGLSDVVWTCKCTLGGELSRACVVTVTSDVQSAHSSCEAAAETSHVAITCLQLFDIKNLRGADVTGSQQARC